MPAGRNRFDQARLINIANALTALRLVLIPMFAYLLISGKEPEALIVFVVGGVSDMLDGLLARWLRQRTLVGAYLDPVADKLMMATAFVVLAYVRVIPYWLTILVITRDIFILVGVSLYLLLLGDTSTGPTALSKANTAVQVVTIAYFLAVVAFPGIADALGVGEESAVAGGAILLCAATTVASGAQYVYLGIRKLSRG